MSGDCWNPCRQRSGFCPGFCGEGFACCRKDFLGPGGNPPECAAGRLGCATHCCVHAALPPPPKPPPPPPPSPPPLCKQLAGRTSVVDGNPRLPQWCIRHNNRPLRCERAYATVGVPPSAFVLSN